MTAGDAAQTSTVTQFALGSCSSTGGSASAAFTPASGTGDGARSVAVQPDGKLVVAGYSKDGDTARVALFRYNNASGLDPTFGDAGRLTTQIGAGWSVADSVAIQSDGKIVVAGSSGTESSGRFALARYNTSCGDGVMDTGEDCDDGNLDVGDCCSPNCLFEPTTSVCRPSTRICDVAENCTGASATCPVDAFQTAPIVCRVASGPCDAEDEVCSGTSADCPPNAPAVAGTICRASSGACDLTEVCNGVEISCPKDSLVAAGTTCRAASGSCDLAEKCSGTTASCPVDVYKGSTITCRATAGVCDVAEKCTGFSAHCPPDGKSMELCRDAVGVCDQADLCDGSSNLCPPDALVEAGTICRGTVRNSV